MEKNDNFSAVVSDVNDDGDGVVKIDKQIVFVPDTWYNEEIEGVIINTKSKFAIGKATKVSTPSKSRITPSCKLSSMCGGCSLQHINYPEQLLYKQQKIKNTFKKFGGIDVEVNKTIPSRPFRYRNKTALPIDPKTRRVGMFRTNSHNILPIADCVITKEWVSKLVSSVNDFLAETNVSIFDENTKSGLVKHLVAREVGGFLLITIVINGESLPHKNILIEKLKEAFGENFGLNLNINKLMNNVILTDKFVHLYGLTHLSSTSFAITYPITNASFMQVNDEISEKIYLSVLENISPDELVVNAYSGAGLLSAMLAKKAKSVYGIEIVEDASKSADLLAKNNGICNLVNICGDCTVKLPALVKKLDKFTIVFDPPRKGLTPELVTAIKLSAPEKIIYISCNPATLARDCKLFLENSNYKITSVTPFDMFPQTAHIETLCILEKTEV